MASLSSWKGRREWSGGAGHLRWPLRLIGSSPQDILGPQPAEGASGKDMGGHHFPEAFVKEYLLGISLQRKRWSSHGFVGPRDSPPGWQLPLVLRKSARATGCHLARARYRGGGRQEVFPRNDT